MVQLGGLEARRPGAALRRPAAARRAGAGDRAGAAGAAARRAAGRAGRAPARGPAGRAQADPGDARDHVRLRHARPGRGADDERPRGGDARRRIEQCGDAAAPLRGARDGVRGQLPRRVEPDPGAWSTAGGLALGDFTLRARRRTARTGDGAGDDPAGAGAARAARGRAARTACRGWSRRSSTSASTRTCACGWRPARWSAATCPTTATAVEHAAGDPVCGAPARRRACACWRSRMRRREELLTARRRRVIGARRASRARRSARSRARRAPSLGLLNYHFDSKDEVVAEAFAEAAREDLAELRGDLAAPRGPGRPAGRVPGPVGVGGRGELAAVGRRVGRVGPLAAGARHARALRRRLARGARRGARRRRRARAAGRAPTRRTPPRGWSR